MAREDAIKQCEDFIKNHSDWSVEAEWANGVEFVLEDYKRLIEQEPIIKALGEELRKARKGIADEKVLIGYNMAVAICNKHLGGSEVEE